MCLVYTKFVIFPAGEDSLLFLRDVGSLDLEDDFLMNKAKAMS